MYTQNNSKYLTSVFFFLVCIARRSPLLALTEYEHLAISTAYCSKFGDANGEFPSRSLPRNKTKIQFDVILLTENFCDFCYFPQYL